MKTFKQQDHNILNAMSACIANYVALHINTLYGHLYQ